jgi:hypothetical protein
MKTKKEDKSMKMVFAVWYWNIHCDPSKGFSPWMVKSFGSESKAETWISQNHWQFFQAEGLHIEIECEADIPNIPPDEAKLLIGERGSGDFRRPGRYPAIDNAVVSRTRVDWRQS